MNIAMWPRRGTKPLPTDMVNLHDAIEFAQDKGFSCSIDRCIHDEMKSLNILRPGAATSISIYNPNRVSRDELRNAMLRANNGVSESFVNVDHIHCRFCGR